MTFPKYFILSVFYGLGRFLQCTSLLRTLQEKKVKNFFLMHVIDICFCKKCINLELIDLKKNYNQQ